MIQKRYFNIEVPKRQNICAKGQEILTPGSDCFSLVSEIEESCFSRYDYCPECWKQLEGSSEAVNAVTVWKSKVPEKEEAAKPSLDRDESALALLKKCAESPDQSERQEAFILALYLARRRLIIQRKEIPGEDGAPDALLYEVAHNGELLVVNKQTLPSLQVEKVQQSLAKKMKEHYRSCKL